MGLKQHQEKILKQLILQEKLLALLYGTFSNQFPQHKPFWEKLFQEEEHHAAILEKLLDAARKGAILFDEGKVKTYTLHAYIERLEGILRKARDHEFTLETALSCAADYETSLIEKNIFTRFSPLSEQVRGALKTLHSETLNHIKRVKELRQTLSG